MEWLFLRTGARALCLCNDLLLRLWSPHLVVFRIQVYGQSPFSSNRKSIPYIVDLDLWLFQHLLHHCYRTMYPPHRIPAVDLYAVCFWQFYAVFGSCIEEAFGRDAGQTSTDYCGDRCDTVRAVPLHEDHLYWVQC